MKTVKGKWTFNDVLTDANIYQEINFSTDGTNFGGGNSWNDLSIGNTGVAPFRVVAFGWWDGETSNAQDVYSFEEYDGGIIQPGWYDEAYKTIDFGETEQTVSDEFYAWLVENAVTSSNNIKINITENGTTTLATAGKYCDRNIDVNTNVPTYEAELAEQKAITDGILNRSITVYVNNTVTKLETYALAFCTKMTKLRCGAVEEMENYCVRYCTSLTEARFDSVKTIKAQVFQNCNKMVKLILGSPSLCELTNVNSFNLTPIADGTGYVYVPDNLVDAYKTATNWSTFANQIKPISELGE